MTHVIRWRTRIIAAVMLGALVGVAVMPDNDWNHPGCPPKDVLVTR